MKININKKINEHIYIYICIYGYHIWLQVYKILGWLHDQPMPYPLGPLNRL